MSKLLLPLSLIVSMSLGMPVRAELSVNNYNSSCSHASITQPIVPSSSIPVKQGFLRNEVRLAQVILDSKPHWSSQCGPIYTIYKNGKVYECHKCTYGGPYCWEKN